MIKNFLKNLIDCAFPDGLTCDICGREIFGKGRLCEDCLKKVTFNDGTTCPVCGRKTDADEICFECKAQAPKFKKGVSAMVYSGGAVTLIHKFKNGNGYLKEYFADLLAPKCSAFADTDFVCYVPMTKSEETARGYNQAELLAVALAERLNKPVEKCAVKKVKKTKEQKTLSRREREKNLDGCFKADKKIVAGKVVILADDVMTTGATAEAVTEALLKAGAKKVYFAAAASVEYKREI